MPKVLRWLSTKLNCSSQTANLLAATAGGDVEVVKGIIAANPELGLYNAEGVIGGGRSALTLAAERGDIKVLKVVYEGAVKAKGESYAKQALNQGSQRGHSPLMRACTFGTSQHVDCVKFLLEKGADPCSETETGDNCLHMAAKNGYVECMNVILQSNVTIGTAEPTRLADVVLPYSNPVKFVDLRNNAGMTALHMTALRQCPSSMQLLLLCGATTTLGTLEGSNLLSKGSTALHIAAARGSQPCCSVLLDHECGRRGSRLRNIRNENGMKASHVARLAGHDALGEMISSSRAPARHTRPHRRRRSHHRDTSARTPGGSHHRQPGNPGVVLQLLKERASLLLSLRDIGLELDAQSLAEGGPIAAVLPKDDQEAKPLLGPQDEVSTAIASFTRMWRSGELENSDSIAQGMLGSFLSSDLNLDTVADDHWGKDGNPFAASALTQACLNALAFFSPAGKALSVPPTEMRMTHPLVAEVLSRVALRKLAGKAVHQPVAHTLPARPPGGISSPPPGPHRATPRQRTSSPHSRPQRSAEVLRTMPLPNGNSKGESGAESIPEVERVSAKARRRQGAQQQQQHDENRAANSVEAADTSARSSDAGTEEPALNGNSHQRNGQHKRRGSTTACREAHEAEGVEHTQGNSLQEGQILAQTDNLVSQLSLAPLTVDSTYTPFEGDASRAWNADERNRGGSAPATPFALPSVLATAQGKGRHTNSSTPTDGTPRAACRPPVSRSESDKLHSRAARLSEASPTPDMSASSVADSAESAPNLLRPEMMGATPHRRRSQLSRADTNESTIPTPSSMPGFTPESDLILAHSSNSESETEDLDLNSDHDEQDSEVALKQKTASDTSCTICMDRPLQVSIWTCGHKVCFGCAYQLASRGLSIPICPFCRGKIADFASTKANQACQEPEQAVLDPRASSVH